MIAKKITAEILGKFEVFYTKDKSKEECQKLLLNISKTSIITEYEDVDMFANIIEEKNISSVQEWMDFNEAYIYGKNKIS